MLLLIIALGCMAFTLIAKWASVTALEQKRARLTEAADMHGQAKFRLKTAVQEVTTSISEIDKHKRKIKTTEHRIERLRNEYKKFHDKAVQQATLDSEKLRLMEEMKKRKGMG